jgi:hypothetical protein
LFPNQKSLTGEVMVAITRLPGSTRARAHQLHGQDGPTPKDEETTQFDKFVAAGILVAVGMKDPAFSLLTDTNNS